MSEKSIRDFIHKGESIIMEKKHVVIGVSGGIAAYKACDLVSKLSGSLTLAHSQNSQMSFMYGFFFVKFLFFTVVCVVIVI